MTYLKTIEWHTTNVFVTITILILNIASNIVCVECHVVIYYKVGNILQVTRKTIIY